MDLLKLTREIGFFETSRNLSHVLDSDAVRAKAEIAMPLPKPCMENIIHRIAVWLTSFGKRKYLFLTPEIALIEEIAVLYPQAEATIVVPSDMGEEVRTRLRNNLPSCMKTSLLEEPFFPKDFYPGNGLITACGYLAGGRTMVLSETYRLIGHYVGGFYGKKVFVPYAEQTVNTRYQEWLEVSTNNFSYLWRDAIWQK